LEVGPGDSKGLRNRQNKQPLTNKRYLDDTERILQDYDMNNDGSLDAQEAKKIARDLAGQKNEKNMMKKVVGAAVTAVSIVLLANVGLVLATLKLTDQVNIESRSTRVDTHVVANVNPTYVRRLLQLHGRRVLSNTMSGDDGSFHDEVRRLNEEVPVAILDDSGEELNEIFTEYEDGVIPVISVEVEGTTYTGSVASGATFTPAVDGCQIYNNIKETGTAEPFYKVKCCGNDNCEVHQLGGFVDQTNVFNRRLDCLNPYCICGSDSDCCAFIGNAECTMYCGNDSKCKQKIVACFSPVSQVVEREQGHMLLKDLKEGNFVLASNGRYRPFLFSAHSNKSRPTHFVQLHTGSSKNAPLEATPDHLVFLYGNKVPIAASKVRVGDLMVGVNGPMAVTKISSVTRKGFYNALTSDATLFVDGVLASSTSTLQEKGDDQHIGFGFFKVHVHTLASWVAAPLIRFGCSKVNSFFCTAQVDDGSGGSLNVLVGSARAVLKFPLPMQALIFTFFVATAATVTVCYCLASFLGTSTVLFGIVTYLQFKLQKKKA